MHILVGLVLAAVLLYFWLTGNWFARVLTFLLFAGVLGFLGAMATGMDAVAPAHNNAWFGALLGIALAWPVSGIPIYVRARVDPAGCAVATGRHAR